MSDAERAKQFYASLGWREDADFAVSEDFRVLQFTPPGSQASIIFGTGVTPAIPGSAGSLLLAVDDIEAARAELIERGVDVSEVFHGVAFSDDRPEPRARPGPERKSYGSFASFSDPDGNEWLLQEVTDAACPGASSEPDVADAGRPAARDGPRATAASRRPPPPHDWWDWYAPYLERARAGQHAGAGHRGRRPLHEGGARCVVPR